jgi:5-methylcytosine-specific restriction protein A
MKAPLKYCAHTPCSTKVPLGTTYCTQHSRQKSREHRYTQHPGYNTYRWQRYRDEFKAAHPFCARCNHALTRVVDHIIPTWVRPELFYEPSNHQPMCVKCNRLKADEDARRYAGQRADFTPTVTKPVLA